MHVEPTEKSLLAGRHAHLPHTAFPSDAYPLEGAVISRFFLPGTLKALTPVHRQKHTREFYSIGTLPAGKISVVGKGWLYTFQPVYLFFQPVNRVRGCGGKRERCFWFPWRLTRFFRPQKGTLSPGLARFEFFARLWPGPCFIYLNAARCTLAAVCIRHSPKDKARHRCRASHLLFLPQFLYLPYPVVK